YIRRPGENGLSGGYMYECFSEPSCVQFAECVRCRLRKPEPEKASRSVLRSICDGGSDHPCNCIFKTALCCRCVRSNDHGIYTVSVHLRSGKEKRSALRKAEGGAAAEQIKQFHG